MDTKGRKNDKADCECCRGEIRMKLRLILKGLQQTNEYEWTTVYKTVIVDAAEDEYNTNWFVVGAEKC